VVTASISVVTFVEPSVRCCPGKSPRWHDAWRRRKSASSAAITPPPASSISITSRWVAARMAS
jgi:hypothetical protein